MVPTEEVSKAFPSAVADLRHIPLGELSAVSPDVLVRAAGRALPGPAASPVPVAAFQSAI